MRNIWMIVLIVSSLLGTGAVAGAATMNGGLTSENMASGGMMGGGIMTGGLMTGIMANGMGDGHCDMDDTGHMHEGTYCDHEHGEECEESQWQHEECEEEMEEQTERNENHCCFQDDSESESLDYKFSNEVQEEQHRDGCGMMG